LPIVRQIRARHRPFSSLVVTAAGEAAWHRVPAAAVQAYLAEVTSRDYLTLDARSHRRLIDHLAEHNVTGSATYDALVGLTAQAAGATLLTRDLRAVATYERLRVEFEPLT
jgi:hypothetical protein